MAYRLNTAEDLGGELRRVALEQLDKATGALERGAPHPPADAIHTARKSVKKTRSLLRLARPALGKRAAGRENAALRDAARLLSGARDADVMVATTAKLAERYVGHAPAATFEALQTALAAKAVEERSSGAAPPAGEAITALRAVRDRAAAWELADVDADALLAGLRRGYERGRDGLSAVRDGGDDEARHDWRKRVKDLWYHQRLLAPAWPEVLGAQAEAAHVLSELLGDDHDLAVLCARLTGEEIPAAADLGLVLELAQRRQREILDEALRLGGRVYAESPKRYERRIGRYLAAWVAEAGETAPAA